MVGEILQARLDAPIIFAGDEPRRSRKRTHLRSLLRTHQVRRSTALVTAVFFLPRSSSGPSLVWLHSWPHTIGTRDWPRVGRSGSLNDQGRVPSPVIKIPMARNNVAVMDYQVHEIDCVHQFFRGPVRTRLAYPDLIAPVLRLKIHIPHDLPDLM
jgi:hypothetical protein